MLRNLLATLIICGSWDWFLYFSPLQTKLAKYKMSPAYPSARQILHDAVMTLSASCIAGLLEICLCHLWAAGQLRPAGKVHPNKQGVSVVGNTVNSKHGSLHQHRHKG